MKIIGHILYKNGWESLKRTIQSMREIVGSIVFANDDSDEITTDEVLAYCDIWGVDAEILTRDLVNDSKGVIDFAAQRNALLDVSKDYEPCWYLYLDADEELSPNGKRMIMDSIFDDYKVVAMPVSNLVNGHTVSSEKKLRLWRSDAGLRWTGELHEHLDIEKLDAAKDIGFIDGEIWHYGYTPELSEEKRLRNLAVSEWQLKTLLKLDDLSVENLQKKAKEGNEARFMIFNYANLCRRPDAILIYKAVVDNADYANHPAQYELNSLALYASPIFLSFSNGKAVKGIQKIVNQAAASSNDPIIKNYQIWLWLNEAYFKQEHQRDLPLERARRELINAERRQDESSVLFTSKTLDIQRSILWGTLYLLKSDPARRDHSFREAINEATKFPGVDAPTIANVVLQILFESRHYHQFLALAQFYSPCHDPEMLAQAAFEVQQYEFAAKAANRAIQRMNEGHGIIRLETLDVLAKSYRKIARPDLAKKIVEFKKDYEKKLREAAQ
ncbi:MAG: hypothetical protein Q8O94_02860 [bacterium]|nr:hypothetical protein [bacterium]